MRTEREQTDRAYHAIFFDWDGTAVTSRSTPADEVVPLMKRLLGKEVVLAVISGTTYNNVASGRLHEHFSSNELKNLFMGLGRGAFAYEFSRGEPVIFHQVLPDGRTLLDLHRLVFDFHSNMLDQYGIPTDVVFSRPNYCKVDLLVGLDRGQRKHLDHQEVGILASLLAEHGYDRGLEGLLQNVAEMGQTMGLPVTATLDAKYLEIGLTTKADSVDAILGRILSRRDFPVEACAFWGDEFGYLAEGVSGSDAHMITSRTRSADFFDVSGSPLSLPSEVIAVGGGVPSFLGFLERQLELHSQ